VVKCNRTIWSNWFRCVITIIL